MKNSGLTSLLSHFSEKPFSKGDYLLKEGQVCQYIFFVKRGMVKICTNNGNREFIMRFFQENIFVTVFNSFVEQTPSRFHIKALEDGVVLMLHRDKMLELCRNSHEIESFFRNFTEKVASQMVTRISGMLQDDASTRYKMFVENNPELMQRISLGDLASYLGITQASLSKIRAKK